MNFRPELIRLKTIKLLIFVLVVGLLLKKFLPRFGVSEEHAFFVALIGAAIAAIIYVPFIIKSYRKDSEEIARLYADHPELVKQAEGFSLGIKRVLFLACFILGTALIFIIRHT